jgi:membrane fusion protein (multidrug efflux system)
MKRTLAWIVVVVVIVGSVAARVATRGDETPARSIAEIHETEGVPVDVATVRRGQVRVTQEIVGEVTGARQSTLRANGSQKIARVNVREGQRVRRGQSLVEFDVAVSPDRVARLKQMRESYENAKRQVGRLRPLYEAGAISESELDAAQTQLAIAEANLRDSRLEVEVVSPIDGVASLVAASAGDVVPDAAVLVQVAALDSVRVVANVSASTAAALEAGDPVFVAGEDSNGIETGARAARGRIARVSLGADPDTRLFRAEAILDNADRSLMPGGVVRLGVVVGAAENVPVVPVAAAIGTSVARSGDSVPLYVIRDGVARSVNARVGLVGSDEMEVTEGVTAGEKVVVFGANLLTDGTRVQLHRVDGELVKATVSDDTAEGNE